MKHKQVKLITTIVCMALSLIALYAFCFVVDVKLGWRIALIVIALSWIVSGILNLIEYRKKWDNRRFGGGCYGC